MRHYFLTGATGVVGSEILKLLHSKSERVTILIRAQSDSHFQKRIEKLYEYCHINPLDSAAINPIQGTLETRRFGLDEVDYVALTKQCTHIVHCAANINMNRPLPIAMAETTAITENILSFFDDLENGEKLEYASTVGVAGNKEGVLKEEWIEDGRRFRNSYEQAKAHSEQLVQKRIDQSGKITVHRPSMIIGNATSGEVISFQVFYYLCEFLSGKYTFGIIPNLKGFTLDVIPVDYVASIIYWSSLNHTGDQTSPILHSCAGDQSIALDELAQTVIQSFNEKGKQLNKQIVMPLWLFGLLIKLLGAIAPAALRKKIKAMRFLLDYLKVHQSFSNELTKAILAKTQISLPPTNQTIRKSLAYYLKVTAKQK